jgi:hypothetical protein
MLRFEPVHASDPPQVTGGTDPIRCRDTRCRGVSGSATNRRLLSDSMGSMTALSHHQATFSYYPDNVGQPRTPETWSDMSWAALRVAAACLAFPAEPPQHWPPPAVAFAERTVAAWPVVTVGFMIMPAGTERSAARPHPSQHSPHLCLSLLSYGGGPRTSVAGHRRAGIREEIWLGYLPAVGDEFTGGQSLDA